MAEIVGLVVPFFALIFSGFAMAKLRPLPLDALGWLNAFIVYWALPALFVTLLARTPFEELTRGSFILGSVGSTFAIFVLMFVGSRLVGGDTPTATMRGLGSAYGNIGYMGPGLALLAFGPAAATPVALIFCFENVMHFTLAPLLMALAGREKASPLQLAGRVARSIALHPFVLATIVGVLIAYSQVELPRFVSVYLDYLARAAAPCALFAMGVTLALRPLRRAPVELVPLAALKLVLHPLLVYMVLSAAGDFPPGWIEVATLLAALPTATNVFVIATQYQVWTERASAAVLVTTCLSVATLTVLIYLFKSGILPPDLFPAD